jgi:hypothetical protein
MDIQPAFDFRPREAARATDDVTSVMAAEDAARNVSRGRMLALRLHYAHPAGLTDFELAKLSGWAQTSIGKRRGDLMNPKYFPTPLIEKTQETRPAPSGSPARVWRITRAGMTFFEAEAAK